MSKIKWNLPGPNEPGFLRRKREVSVLLDADPTPAAIDELLAYLAQFVDGDQAHALEALLDCSRLEYGHTVMELLGYNFKVPDPKGGSSEGP